MLQIFKYNLKQLLHNRSELFWVILFPIILGSLFKAAFSNITAGEKFQAIPVAIVNEQGSMSDGFMETVKELDKDDKDRFLKAVYCDKKQALSLLKKEKVDGIIQVDDNIAPILMRAGMHCIGCPASQGESLEEACMVHGIDCDTLVSQINEILSSKA